MTDERFPILQIQKVHQVFRTGFWMRNVQVLKDVSFEIPARSVFGLLGPNGAGKTTLIQLITGFRRPTTGKILVRGEEASTAQAKSRIGYMPERPYFPDFLTGEKLLRYMGTLSGMSRDEIERRIPKVLEQVGMTHARKKELSKYSKGMLQRIGIAQAIFHDPEILVLDEPMSGLDPVGRREIRELIQELGAKGKTVFFSTHIIHDVETICQQVAILNRGELIGAGLISDLLKNKTQRFEIGFTGITPAAANRLTQDFVSLTEISEGFRIVVDEEKAAERVLKKLLLQDARVLWMNPIRPSLETYFERTGSEATKQ